ncbi:MAG: PAS domain-containing protein, partial [Bacteroidia bacterium]
MLNFNELQLLCLYIDDFARNNIENALLGQRLSVEYRKYDAVNGSLNFSSKKKYRLIILFIDLKYDAYLQLLRASKEQFENVNFIIIDDKIEPDKMPELLNFGVCDIVFTKHINRLSVSVQLALNRFIGEIQNNEKLNSYRQISNISRTGGWELNLKNNRLFWSSVTKEIHEVSQNFEPDLNSGINFYKKGWSRKTIQKAIENAIENGESYDLKLIIVTANNNERWIRAMGKAEIENGICTRIFGTFRDITDQHELTTQLRNTNTRLTALLESIGGASFQIKVDKKEVFTIHYISSGFEKMHELSIDEVTNDSSLLIKVVHPDFRKFMIEKSQDAIKNHKVYEAKFKIFTKSGIEKWIQTYGVPSIDPEGNQ